MICLKSSKQFKLTIVLFFLFTIGNVSCFAQGTTYEVGKYKVIVDVRTSKAQIIPHANVKCKKSGKSIKVSVYAPGYCSKDKEIRIISGIDTYYANFSLRDKEVSFKVYSFDHKVLKSCYFESNQTGVPTDMFQVCLFIPIKGWPHPSPSNIYMNQPGYGWPIQDSCDISIREDFYQVKMLIMRAFLDIDDPLLVYVNTNVVIEKASAERWFSMIQELENDYPATSNDLAQILFRIMPPGLNPAILPISITRILELQNRFKQLHKATE